MFNNPQYSRPVWPITQHMKLVTGGGIYDLLYAAATFSAEYYPAERINEYIITNAVLPPNIRADNDQPNVWRDYQQVLAELGLIYSTKVTTSKSIVLTSSGLSLIDDKSRLADILTSQVLLYQYPNGGKRDYADEQVENGVLIRPAVLAWSVLKMLSDAGEGVYLKTQELRDYLMRATRHEDAAECAEAIIQARNGQQGLPVNSITNSGRNATDWIALLTSTLLFKSHPIGGNEKAFTFSQYALDNFAELDEAIQHLEDDATFWRPAQLDDAARVEWYSFYGALRLDFGLPVNDDDDNEEVEPNGEREVGFGVVASLNMNEFNPERLNAIHTNRPNRSHTIESSYDAGMVDNKHRLHDAMIIYIAKQCRAKGAMVFEDPKSFDLLIIHDDVEYLVEVKTVTPRNYVKRLRYAIGQLYHYDFMLGPTAATNRRLVLAIPSVLPSAASFIPFFNSHLDIDLLSLVPTPEGQVLQCNSNSAESIFLFTSEVD